MNTNKVLTTFRIPLRLRDRFDAICDAKGVTRTSMLQTLIEVFIIEQASAMERQQALWERFDATMESKREAIASQDDMPLGWQTY